MAKLILTSRYLRDAPPERLNNYVRYIGTRDGVEKTGGSGKNFPATQPQKNLVGQIIKDIPEAKEILEYQDYIRFPTVGNASEFITQALEQNLDMAGVKENYVEYLANRPRVERVGEHGLFTDAGKPVILADVQREVSDHKGPVWTHVISLRREDAKRLGYDSAKQWMALLRSKRAMLCKWMKIDSADLRWYAAFHNEGHHPHVHLMVYSAKEGGYLTKPGIEAMRSELAHDIFRQDFAQIYEGQDESRKELKEEAAKRMRALAEKNDGSVCENPAIGEMLLRLSARLQKTRGKKVYGYLKADVKRLVDEIVDELAKEPEISEAYQAWGEWRERILLTYSSAAPPLPPLSQQKQFKSIKNMVIAEALQLGERHFFMGGQTEPALPPDEAEDVFFSEPDEERDGTINEYETKVDAVDRNTTGADMANEYEAKAYAAVENEIRLDAIDWNMADGNTAGPEDVSGKEEKDASGKNDSVRDADLILAATRLMRYLSRIFQEDYRRLSGDGGAGHIDRKRWRKLQEKRIAQGHKKDDHEPKQTV